MPNREEIHVAIAKLLLAATNGMTAATLTTALAGANNDMTLTAKVPGVGGNAIALILTDPAAPSIALSVAVTAASINVTLATNGGSTITSTASEVVALLNANASASSLITAVVKTGDTGAGVVTALASTPLAGGAATIVAQTTTSLDCAGYDSAEFDLHFGALAPAPTTIVMQDSDDNSAWGTAASVSTISDYDTTVSLVNKTVRIAYVGPKRYARLVITPSAATDLTVTGRAGYASTKPTANPT